MTKAVTLLLKQLKYRFGDYPKLVQFDDGKEFYNVGLNALLEKHYVNHFGTNTDNKAAVVELFNGTLITAMWKNVYAKGTYNWTNVLDQLEGNYYGTKHSTILVKPKDVISKNEAAIWYTLLQFKIVRCQNSR